MNTNRQYRTADNLNARKGLHSRFSINPYGWFPWVFDQFSFPAECRILEIGCGTGDLWKANRHRIPLGWHITLTDSSEGMVAAAKGVVNLLPQIESISIADAQALPFDQHCFDAVIVNHVLFHVPALDSALSEIHRVLSPGGVLVATTTGLANMKDLYDLFDLCAVDKSLYMQSATVVERFSLENGASKIAEWFDDIELRIYDDALEVTEVEPLVDYAQSLAVGGQPILSDEALRRFVLIVEEQIDKRGAFHISKSSGMFVAKK